MQEKNLPAAIVFVDFAKAFDIHREKMNQILISYGIPKKIVTDVTDVDFADDLAITADYLTDATFLLHEIETAASEIGLYINSSKTEFICYNQSHTGFIPSKNNGIVKAVEDFVYLGSNIASTKRDVEVRLGKAWTAIRKLDKIWKSNLPEQLKRRFFRSSVEPVLLYGSSAWTLTASLEKSIDGSYTRMLRAALNIPWQQHPTKRRLYGNLSPISSTIREQRLRFAGHCWRSKTELVSDLLLWTPKHGKSNRGRPFKTFVKQLEDDSGYLQEDLTRLMADRNRWREIVTACRASST